MDNSLKLTALSPDLAVKLLTQSGSRIASLEVLKKDLENGAPKNPDGTINIIEYAAYLAKEGNNVAESE